MGELKEEIIETSMREHRRVDNERIVAEMAEKRRLKDLEIRNKEKDDFG